jgi:hypothetical protein
MTMLSKEENDKQGKSNKKNNDKKLAKVLSTKLSMDDYNEFTILAKLVYEE